MYIQTEVKTCTKCGESKPLTQFYKAKKSPDGYRWHCIPCHRSFESQRNPARRKEYSSRHYLKRKQENPALFMWKQAKHRAEFDYNGMEFTISVEDITIPTHCPYFGVLLEPLHPEWGYSLDRVDSSRGYTPTNIQVISRKANIMKNNATKEQLIAFAKGVLEVHSKEGLCDVHTD